MNADLAREMAKADGRRPKTGDDWEVIPDLGSLQQENAALKRMLDGELTLEKKIFSRGLRQTVSM